MTKQDIIDIIKNEITPSNDEKSVFSSKDSYRDKIGSTQFHELAVLCKQAECYEEVELLVRYSESKCETGKSWSHKYKSGTLADTVIKGMEEVKKSSENDKSCVKNLSYFFGYLYRFARIWAAESK